MCVLVFLLCTRVFSFSCSVLRNRSRLYLLRVRASSRLKRGLLYYIERTKKNQNSTYRLQQFIIMQLPVTYGLRNKNKFIFLLQCAIIFVNINHQYCTIFVRSFSYFSSHFNQNEFLCSSFHRYTIQL